MQVSQDEEIIKSYAAKGAQYLSSIGFNDRFCRICEGINRYNEQEYRERESDVLELVDNFGAMLLDRPERVGMEVDEALVLLEYRNLRDVYNRYLYQFVEFIKNLETIKIKNENQELTLLELLVKIFRETDDIKHFITAVVYEYESKVDDEICRVKSNEFFRVHKNKKKLEVGNPNRPLFSEEITKKVIGELINKKD